jgi:hypothetical protein
MSAAGNAEIVDAALGFLDLVHSNRGQSREA